MYHVHHVHHIYHLYHVCPIYHVYHVYFRAEGAKVDRRSTEGRPLKVTHGSEGRPSVVDFNLESNCIQSTILLTYINKPVTHLHLIHLHIYTLFSYLF